MFSNRRVCGEREFLSSPERPLLRPMEIPGILKYFEQGRRFNGGFYVKRKVGSWCKFCAL